MMSYIVQIDHGRWLNGSFDDPGVTDVKNNARVFEDKEGALRAKSIAAVESRTPLLDIAVVSITQELPCPACATLNDVTEKIPEYEKNTNVVSCHDCGHRFLIGWRRAAEIR